MSTQTNGVSAKPAPDLNIPHSDKTVTVKIVNSTAFLRTTAINTFMHPTYKGHEVMTGPAFSFLVEHEADGKTRRLVFDLGLRKDWENLAPSFVSYLSDGSWELHTEKNVQDILAEGGIELSSVEALIWSHWHFDHTGDPSGFPTSSELIVGPGFTEAFVPGYPTNPKGMILESDYKDRNLRELDFTKNENGLMLGRFPAIDYFGDGSFYILDAPGHAIGHICGLARTTASPPTFILMGADCCHHGGEFRPSEYLPLPKYIVPNPINPRRAGVWPRGKTDFPCPGSLFLDIHHKKSATQPFYELAPDGVHHDKPATEETIAKVQEFDAVDDIMVVMAHDETILDVVDFFPKHANDWKAKGWGKEARWAFLRDISGGVGNFCGKF